MRLINSYEFKQKLLTDRYLLVPKTLNTPFAQAVRYGFHRALRCMEQCTTIYAEPVVHGRWESVPGNGIGGTARCSVCGKAIYGYHTMNYCPNCGAKMDGKDGDSDGTA